MNSNEQIPQITLEHAQKIAALEQMYSSMGKRIDENGHVTTGIHKLAANVESLTGELKRLGEKLETGLKEQGKRIGEAESKLVSLAAIEKSVRENDTRLDALEREPGQKWRTLTAQIVSIVVTAVVTGLVMNFINTP